MRTPASFCIAAITGLSCLTAAQAQSDAVADFYAGKSITLIVSTGAGGGLDAVSTRFSPSRVIRMPAATACAKAVTAVICAQSTR